MNIFEKIKTIRMEKQAKKREQIKREKELGSDVDSDERETWGGQLDFFLSTLGYAVGLGNIWRFPYLCYKNGGGVFLIPYTICLFFFGIPLMYIEMAVGQYTSTGPLTSWRMVPIFNGIGIGMNIANAYITFFYNMLMGYALYYIVLSFTSELPWQKCQPEWANTNCVDDYSVGAYTYQTCGNNLTEYKCEVIGSVNFGQCFNLTSLNSSLFNLTDICYAGNNSIAESSGYWKSSFPSSDYWTKVILQDSGSIDQSGKMVWQLVLSLFVSWIMVYLIIFMGVKVSGKIAWFTSLFPYVILLILGIRGWLLPGADIGIKFYILPEWSKLSQTGVWIDAASQIFFSFSLGYGGISALSSYNKFNHNILRDSILIPIINWLTSFFAGFVIFAYMGYLSFVTGQDIKTIATAGQGLAFVIYPYAVTTIAGAPFWSICFFFMVILLAVDTAVASVETTVTSILDAFPVLKSTKIRRHIAVIAICVFYFLGGLLFTIQSGSYWLELFNTYAGDWAILILGAIESIAISWFYGFNYFRIDLVAMVGEKYVNNFTYYIWYILWAFVTPVFLIVLVGINFPNVSNIVVDTYRYPDWSHILGECITASILVGVFVVAIYQIIYLVGIKKQSFLSLFKPDLMNYHPRKEDNQRLIAIARGISYADVKEGNFQNMGFELEEPDILKTVF